MAAPGLSAWTLAQRVAEVAPDPRLSPSRGFWRERRWGGDHVLALLGSLVAWTQALRAQSPSPCPALPRAPAPCPRHPHGPAAAPSLLRRCLTERGPSAAATGSPRPPGRGTCTRPGRSQQQTGSPGGAKGDLSLRPDTPPCPRKASPPRYGHTDILGCARVLARPGSVLAGEWALIQPVPS